MQCSPVHDGLRYTQEQTPGIPGSQWNGTGRPRVYPAQAVVSETSGCVHRHSGLAQGPAVCPGCTLGMELAAPGCTLVPPVGWGDFGLLLAALPPCAGPSGTPWVYPEWDLRPQGIPWCCQGDGRFWVASGGTLTLRRARRALLDRLRWRPCSRRRGCPPAFGGPVQGGSGLQEALGHEGQVVGMGLGSVHGGISGLGVSLRLPSHKSQVTSHRGLTPWAARSLLGPAWRLLSDGNHGACHTSRAPSHSMRLSHTSQGHDSQGARRFLTLV